METVDMTISRFWDFRQNFEFRTLRSNFTSKVHIWILQATFSVEKSIYGPYKPHTSGRKSIYGPHRPHISGRKSICGPPISLFLERVLIYGPPVSLYFWWEVHIAVLWVSELILWMSELIPLYFGCLNLYSGSLKLYRCTSDVWTYTLDVWFSRWLPQVTAPTSLVRWT